MTATKSHRVSASVSAEQRDFQHDQPGTKAAHTGDDALPLPAHQRVQDVLQLGQRGLVAITGVARASSTCRLAELGESAPATGFSAWPREPIAYAPARPPSDIHFAGER